MDESRIQLQTMFQEGEETCSGTNADRRQYKFSRRQLTLARPPKIRPDRRYHRRQVEMCGVFGPSSAFAA